MKLKEFVKEYFTFSRGERNGIIILLFLIVVFAFVSKYIHLLKPDESIDFSEYEQKIDEFEKSLKQQNNQFNDTSALLSNADTVNVPDSLFKFDPNTATDTIFLMLGVKSKQIKTIRNYLSKGGKFYKPEGFKKIYGISPTLYDKLEPYIEIAQLEKQKEYSKEYTKEYPKYNNFNDKKPYTKDQTYVKKDVSVIVEINAADTTELKKIKGIGSSFAKRIIKYRDMLGGFIKKEQLLEVYGIDSLKYVQIQPFIEINSSLINKININTATIEEMGKRPYIKYKNAKSIINHRTKKGLFKSVDDVFINYLVSEKDYLIMKPYLKVN